MVVAVAVVMMTEMKRSVACLARLEGVVAAVALRRSRAFPLRPMDRRRWCRRPRRGRQGEAVAATATAATVAAAAAAAVVVVLVALSEKWR